MQPNQEVVYQDQKHGVDIVKEPMAGGGATYTSRPMGQPEEKDPEADVGVGAPVYVQSATTQTTQQTTATTAVPPAVRRTDVRPAPQPRDTTRKSGGLMNTFVTRSTGPFFFSLHAAIAFFSFLVLVSAAYILNNTVVQRWVQYELTIGQIGLAVSLGACIMERLGLLEHIGVRIALSAFQMILWFPALILMTFFGTFLTPLANANGFFGAWGALAASAVVFVHEAERYRKYHRGRDNGRDYNNQPSGYSNQQTGQTGYNTQAPVYTHQTGSTTTTTANTTAPRRRGDDQDSTSPRLSLVLVFLFSLMIMGSGIRVYYTAAAAVAWSYVLFSFIFGAITAFIALVLLAVFEAVSNPVMITIGTIFFIWIAVGVCFLTFGAPFETALGNGYYSCLFTLLASFGLLLSLKRRGRDDTTMGVNEATERSARRFFLYMRVMTFASLMEMVAASLVCRNTGGCSGSIPRYEVAAGAIALGVGLIIILLEAFGAQRVSGTPKIIIALFLMLWWVAAFIVLTYFGTFTTPTFQSAYYANGFFFTWVALIAAALAFAEAIKERSLEADPPSPMVAKIGFLFLIIIGSAIELGAGIVWYYNTGNSVLSRYALSLGSVSIFLVIVMYFVLGATHNNYELHDGIYNFGLYLLTIWWAVGLLVLTFDGLWSVALDNGYFSLFFTLGTCLLALSGIWRHEEVEMDDDRNENRNDVYVEQRTVATDQRNVTGPARTDGNVYGRTNLATQ
jgi:hypothetical protein